VFAGFMGFIQNDFERFGGKQVGHSFLPLQIDAAVHKKTGHFKTKTLRRNGGV
jgi:hypothetical protein